MPHFRNFQGLVPSKKTIADLEIDQDTINASERFDDLGIDQETITANNRDDMIVNKLDAYDLVDKFDFGDVAPVRGETINVSQSDDQLFDPNDFGATPPLDLSYVIDDGPMDASDILFDFAQDIG